MKSFCKPQPQKFNQQYATAYAVFMACSELFDNCKINPCMEKRMYLHYAEMPESKTQNGKKRKTESKNSLERKTQERLEEIGAGYLKKLSDLRCQVTFSNEDGILVIHFDTGGFESLTCAVLANGQFGIIPTWGVMQAGSHEIWFVQDFDKNLKHIYA